MEKGRLVPPELSFVQTSGLKLSIAPRLLRLLRRKLAVSPAPRFARRVCASPTFVRNQDVELVPELLFPLPPFVLRLLIHRLPLQRALPPTHPRLASLSNGGRLCGWRRGRRVRCDYAHSPCRKDVGIDWLVRSCENIAPQGPVESWQDSRAQERGKREKPLQGFHPARRGRRFTREGTGTSIIAHHCWTALSESADRRDNWRTSFHLKAMYNTCTLCKHLKHFRLANISLKVCPSTWSR